MAKKNVKKEVKELLNQIVLLLKNVDHQEEMIWDDEANNGDGDEIYNPDYSDEDHELCIIKHACKDLIGKGSGDLDMFYSSYCYWND